MVQRMIFPSHRFSRKRRHDMIFDVLHLRTMVLIGFTNSEFNTKWLKIKREIRD